MMEQILYLGDIHGNFEYIKGQIKRKQIGNNDDVTYIIQLGDFGIGFNPNSDQQTLEHLNKFLKLRNIIMIAMRGNHDCPNFFKGDHMFSNLMLVPDYTVMDIYGNRHLFIGGAISIDRKMRLKDDTVAARYGSTRRSYWFDEKVILDEEKLSQISNIDILLTHTAPDWCTPLNKIGFGGLVDSFSENDPTLKDELKEERELMSKIFNLIQKQSFVKNHYYGHFHRSDITLNNGCQHQLVDINEFVEFK